MRPQQNRRMRGRGNNNNNSNNNNRKGPNPLTRSYESNGPDVKIRGSAQQIAEKYTTLARDAQTSGDRVMAENYLQHAEHYNRLIMAAQAQMPQQQVRDTRDDDDQDDDSEENFNQAPAEQQVQHRNEQQPQQHQHNGSGPQPVIEGTPAEVALKQGGIVQNGSEPRDEPASESGNGAVDATDEQADAAPRRARRPRRNSRPRTDDASGDGESAGAGEEPVPEAAQ